MKILKHQDLILELYCLLYEANYPKHYHFKKYGNETIITCKMMLNLFF